MHSVDSMTAGYSLNRFGKPHHRTWFRITGNYFFTGLSLRFIFQEKHYLPPHETKISKRGGNTLRIQVKKYWYSCSHQYFSYLVTTQGDQKKMKCKNNWDLTWMFSCPLNQKHFDTHFHWKHKFHGQQKYNSNLKTTNMKWNLLWEYHAEVRLWKKHKVYSIPANLF